MNTNKNVFTSLKTYIIRENVKKNHYPFKYWFSNRNLFIQLTFWVWFIWFLMAISAIFLPVNNQLKIGRGAVVVFESAFSYVVRILGSPREGISINENTSPQLWNLEAYMFIYLTIVLLVLMAYSFHLVKNFLIDLNDIFRSNGERGLQAKIYVLRKFIKFFIVCGALLVVWSSFALLYMKKPLESVVTILFKEVKEAANATGKTYFKSLTKVGWATGFLNVGFLVISFALYIKYAREIFSNNRFLFKSLRIENARERESANLSTLDRETMEYGKKLKGGEYQVKNREGFIVELKGVNKYFQVDGGYFHALKDINLEIKEGDFVVILGYSGSGKTTLLNLLSGIDRPTSGSCVIGDCETSKMTDEELNLFRREKIGYIFQNYALLPNLTVQENIAITQNMNSVGFRFKFGRFKERLSGEAKFRDNFRVFVDFLKDVFLSREDNEELGYLMNSLGLSEHSDKYPHQLSGGQQQRVAITRALVKKPVILLADEPTGALDYSMTKSILELFYKINEYSKTTIILITHNPLIAKMAKRVLYVSDGKIIEDIKNLKPQKPWEIKGL